MQAGSSITSTTRNLTAIPADTPSIASTTAAPRVRSRSNSDNAALLQLNTGSIANQFLQAVNNGNIDKSLEFIEQGASVNQTDPSGKTALAIAAMNGDINMMQALLAAGANADGSPTNALQTLMGGISMPAIVQQGLAVIGFGVGVMNFGIIGSVAGLLGVLAVDFNLRAGHDCCTPLIMAAKYGHTPAVRVLLDAGARIDFTDEKGNSALGKAAENGCTDTVKALLGAGARFDGMNDAYKSALLLAAENGHTETVKALLEAGAMVYDDRRILGRSPLIVAASNGHTETVRALLNAGAKVNESAFYYEESDAIPTVEGTALIFAARKGHTETLKALLEAGANVQFALPDGETALKIAQQNGYTEAVKILREAFIKSLG